MPKNIAKDFEKKYTIDPDTVKHNLYCEANPNVYLANFASFMYDYRDTDYIKNLILEGFEEFFRYRILPYPQAKTTDIYFIGSIAYYFKSLLEKVSKKHNLRISGIIQRPIYNLLKYHKNKID